MSTERPRNTKPLRKSSSESRGNWLGRLSTRWAILLLAGVSVLLIALAVFSAFYISSAISSPAFKPDLTPPVSLDELATEFPKLASILTDERLDSVYKDFLVTYQEGGIKAAYELAKKRGLLNAKDELVLTLELDTTDTDPLKAELEAYGIKVTAVSGNLMDVAVPLEIIERSLESDTPGGIFNEITSLEHVVRIRMPIPSLEDAGMVDSESLPIIGAIEWQEAGYTGKGIKVGILDKGFNYYKDLLGTDLPDSVVAKSFYAPYEPDNGTTEHGTAVAEIVHDIAPDAELFFAPYGTNTERDQAVDWLLSQGVDIIQNSTGGIVGPFDGTGPGARLVDRVVERGVLWVNSAGNAAQSHYRGTFTDDDGNGFHEFTSGEDLIGFTVPEGVIAVVLNWDDWVDGVQDLDLYLYDGEGNEIASSRNTQNGPGSEAFEGVLYEFLDNGPYYAAFYAVRVTRSVVLDFFVWDGELEYQVPEYSITTPADARRALTVGAVYWENDALEDYSSQGPSHDGRLKPELAAPTMVDSVAYGEPWPGTSASAPHVSGAAALVMQAFPDYGPDQVIEFLESRAMDLGSDGRDNTYGYGRLWLGPPPGSSSSPAPTEEVVPAPPLLEETATRSNDKTATPTRRHTATPSSESSGEGASLGVLLCVAIPGLLGLGGIGLLGVILHKSRSQPISREPYGMPVVPPISPPVSPPASPELWISPKVEIANACPRCGISHRPQARFCPVCGLALQPDMQPAGETTYCVYCGKLLRPSSQFCTKCGKPVKA